MTFIEFLRADYTPQTVVSYNYTIESFLNKNPDASNYNYSELVNSIFKHKMYDGKHLAALKQYYSYLISLGLRHDHPCLNLTVKQKRKHLQFQDLFSPCELDILLNRENRYKDLMSRNKLLLGLLIYQGLTPENLMNLKWEHFNFEEQSVQIIATRTLHRRKMNLYEHQIHELLNYVNTVLYQGHNHRNKTLLLTKLGDKITVDCIQNILKPLKYLYPERNLNAQTIRQSVISNWINIQGKTLEETFDLAGHKWLSSTERYKRSNIAERKSMIDQFHPL